MISVLIPTKGRPGFLRGGLSRSGVAAGPGYRVITWSTRPAKAR